MLQLQIADPNVSSGSVGVSWCLDHEILKELAAKGLHDPQIVIVVAPTKHYHTAKESRKVVPLKDLMTYIECRVAGDNKIYGLISFMEPKKAREHYLVKEDGVYLNNVLDYDGESYSSRLLGQEDSDDIDSGNYKYLSEPLAISVPKGVFAPEPPKWEKQWVNLFFRSKVIDQCHYRKRRMFAYSVQLLIVGFNLLVRSVLLLLGLLTGARDLSLKYLNPISYRWKDVFEIWERGSIFIFRQPEDENPNEDLKYIPAGYLFRSFWLAPLMPLIAIPVLLLYWFGHPVWASGILLSLFLFLPALLVGTSYLAVNGNGGRIVKKVWGTVTNMFVSDELWYMQQEDMQLITCNTEKKPTTYNSIPAKRKTVRLRFQNLKTKVCKPFSA